MAVLAGLVTLLQLFLTGEVLLQRLLRLLELPLDLLNLVLTGLGLRLSRFQLVLYLSFSKMDELLLWVCCQLNWSLFIHIMTSYSKMFLTLEPAHLIHAYKMYVPGSAAHLLGVGLSLLKLLLLLGQLALILLQLSLDLGQLGLNL